MENTKLIFLLLFACLITNSRSLTRKGKPLKQRHAVLPVSFLVGGKPS